MFVNPLVSPGLLGVLAGASFGSAIGMNDPLASFQTFLHVAREAKERGLYVACASNAYFTSSSLVALSGLLDAINIGVKGMAARPLRSMRSPTCRPMPKLTAASSRAWSRV